MEMACLVDSAEVRLVAANVSGAVDAAGTASSPDLVISTLLWAYDKLIRKRALFKSTQLKKDDLLHPSALSTSAERRDAIDVPF